MGIFYDGGDWFTHIDCWKLLFKGIPPGGLDKLETFQAGENFPYICPNTIGEMFQALVEIYVDSSCTLLKNVSTLKISETSETKDLSGLSNALLYERFPSLRTLTFHGKCTIYLASYED